MAAFFKKKSKTYDSSSLYSVVSCSDLTPGSLAVWVDLPETIKYDPLLAPFRQRYEQNHGEKENNVNQDVDKSNGKNIELQTLSQNAINANNKECSDRLMQDFITDNNEQKNESPKVERIQKAFRIIKLTTLVSCWILLTLALLMNQETEDVVLHATVEKDVLTEYKLSPSLDSTSIRLTLKGPFSQEKDNNTNKAYIWLSRSTYFNESIVEQNSTLWFINLQPSESMDFSRSMTAEKTLFLDSLDTDYSNLNVDSNDTNITLRISTTSDKTVPITLTYMMNPISETTGIMFSTILLLFLYIMIIFEVINRTIAALLSSSLGVAILAISGCRPSLPELVSWLDVETLLLLFSMMLLVAILADTGIFDYLAVLAFELTGGRTWPLINCLCLFTAVFSTFLDNVTTVLLMTPVTIRLCEVMQLNPVPILMSMVIFSNVGGSATPVGDPPNVIIASHPAMLRENINFMTFTLHMGIGILFVCLQTYLQLRFMFRDMNKLRHSVPVEIQDEIDTMELRQEIAVWRRAAASLTSYSRDEDIVRKALEKKVNKLSVALKKREAGSSTSKNDPKFTSTLAEMKEKYCIRNKQLLIKSTVCVSFVVLVFFLHAFPALQRLSLGWTALLGAILLLLISECEDLEPVLARVEWSTLLFFAALFVLMEVLSKLGLISWIGNVTESVILKVSEEHRLGVAIMLILWVSGLASAFVDNIPLTTMMVRVVATLADPQGLALPLAPLAWALSFGACLGGNGTLIGASANVVCAGVAEQHGYRFTFLQYLKVGFPVMIGNLLVASTYLLVSHCLFSWH